MAEDVLYLSIKSKVHLLARSSGAVSTQKCQLRVLSRGLALAVERGDVSPYRSLCVRLRDSATKLRCGRGRCRNVCVGELPAGEDTSPFLVLGPGPRSMEEVTMETKEECYFRALYQVAVTINSSLEPWRVLRSIAESTARTLGTKACSIMLLSPDRKELRHSADYGLSEWYVRKGPVNVDHSMAEALQGRSVAVLDAATDSRVQYGPEATREGIASMLSVPIRLRDDVIGVVRLYSAQRREFTPGEMEFVEAVANLGAIALENARRHSEVKSNYDMVSKYVFNDTWVGQFSESARQA